MDKVKQYVEKNYKSYQGKILIIEEHDSFFTVKSNKDESPLILSKEIL